MGPITEMNTTGTALLHPKVFHSTRIVAKRSVFLCSMRTRLELMILESLSFMFEGNGKRQS